MDTEEFEVKVGMHQRFVPLPFLFTVVVDVVTEVCQRGCTELLYADDLVLMSETMLLLLSTPLHQRAASRVQHPNHVAANSLSPQVARKGSTLSGFVQRSRLEREVGRDLHSKDVETLSETICGGITKNSMYKSNVYPCGVCSLRVKANSVLCVKCVKWIHGICAGMKRVTPKL